jgi:hypothetical protein
MQRREFITLIGGSAAAWPLSARAQQPSIPVIGYLESASQGQFSDLIPAFRKGLSETGYIEGQNVRIEYRWAEGQYDRLPTLTAELVRGYATLIFTTAFNSAQAAKAVTTTVPIVFVSGPDPVQLGLVASLNRPGGNLSGVTLFTSTVVAKRLQLLRELLPEVTTFGFIVNPGNTRADSDIQSMPVPRCMLPLAFQARPRGGDTLCLFKSRTNSMSAALSGTRFEWSKIRIAESGSRVQMPRARGSAQTYRNSPSFLATSSTRRRAERRRGAARIQANCVDRATCSPASCGVGRAVRGWRRMERTDRDASRMAKELKRGKRR